MSNCAAAENSLFGGLTYPSICRARNHQAESSATPPATELIASTSSTPGTPRKRTEVPLKGDGGPSPARSIPGRNDVSDTDTIASDRLSVMSFAFKGSDRIKPLPQTGPVKSSLPPTSAHDPPKRSSGGYVAGTAANAKFAHRLRSADENETITRPGSRARKSLPPTMASKPALMAGNAKANVASSRRATPAPKPAWKASTAPEKRSNTPSVHKGKHIASPGPVNGKGLLRDEITASPTMESVAARSRTTYQDEVEDKQVRKNGVAGLAGRQLGGRI